MRRLLSAGIPVTVVNVFTVSDYAPYFEGEGDAAQVSPIRLREDETFVNRLRTDTKGDVGLIDLHWQDAPLRRSIDLSWVTDASYSDVELGQDVQALLPELSILEHFSLVLVPHALGGHLDHRIAKLAAMRLLPPDRVLFYQDLPYTARLSAADRVSFLECIGDDSLAEYLVRLPNGGAAKLEDAMVYGSQIAPEVADEMAAYVEACGGEVLTATPAGAAALQAMLTASLETVSR